MATSVIKRSGNQFHQLTTITTPVDISSDITITLNSSCENYSFITCYLTATSGNGSSTRGVLCVPVFMLTLGAYFTCAVGNQPPQNIRVSIVSGSNWQQIRFLSTDFTSLYLVNIYGLQ